MTMSDYHEYYDKLYSSKDYARESRIILNVAKRILGRMPRKMLDIGCGTGSHSIELSRQGMTVVGTDIDKKFIAVALEKARRLPPKSRPQFFCKDIANIAMTGFDLAISLFFVINYISDEEYLLNFFTSIHRRLKKRGVFVFDCWNGLAVMFDPPRLKKSRIVSNGEGITVVTKPIKIDLMNQTVQLRNAVRVARRKYPLKHFNFTYTSTLWTPWHLKNVLERAGFKVHAISQWMKPGRVADYKTWKIMFVCQRIK